MELYKRLVLGMACLTAMAAIFFPTLSKAESSSERTIVGYVETVRLYPGDLTFDARIDTGARNSSLHASDIAQFDRDGAKWVRFKTVDNSGKEITLERPLLGTVEVPRHYGKTQTRPLIRLGICLAGVYKEAKVNLVDRGGLKYRMLVGRTYMKKSFLVDPSAKFTIAPNCPKAPAK